MGVGIYKRFNDALMIIEQERVTPKYENSSINNKLYIVIDHLYPNLSDTNNELNYILSFGTIRKVLISLWRS